MYCQIEIYFVSLLFQETFDEFRWYSDRESISESFKEVMNYLESVNGVDATVHANIIDGEEARSCWYTCEFGFQIVN